MYSASKECRWFSNAPLRFGWNRASTQGWWVDYHWMPPGIACVPLRCAAIRHWSADNIGSRAPGTCGLVPHCIVPGTLCRSAIVPDGWGKRHMILVDWHWSRYTQIHTRRMVNAGIQIYRRKSLLRYCPHIQIIYTEIIGHTQHSKETVIFMQIENNTQVGSTHTLKTNTIDLGFDFSPRIKCM